MGSKEVLMSQSGPNEQPEKRMESPVEVGHLIVPKSPSLSADAVEYTFRAHVEHVFTDFGCADTGIVDYASDLCSGFVRTEDAFNEKTPSGQTVWSITQLASLADASASDPEKCYLRSKNVGDVILFFNGFYPDGLKKFYDRTHEQLLDYKELAVTYFRRAARASSDLAFELECGLRSPSAGERIVPAPVLKRVSDNFDFMSYCLHEVSGSFRGN